MNFLQKIFGLDPEIEKQDAFQKIEQQFKGSNINKSKACWLTMRGNNYAMRRRFDQAITDFKEALQFEPNRPSTLVSLGGAYNHKKMWQEGIVTLEKAAEFLSTINNEFFRSTQEFNIFYELGHAYYFFRDDREKAAQALSSALEVAHRIHSLNTYNKISDEEYSLWLRTSKYMESNAEVLLNQLKRSI